jgi:hypothetical protein
MDNHYHLLIETLEPNLSLGMRHVNGYYTQVFNKRHKKVGHLFQGRYKSILVEKGSHLLELIRYVVLNPVRAGMVERPEQYEWSSYNGTVGYLRKLPWLSTDWVLGQFGDKRAEAVRRYETFVREGIGKKEKPWESLIGQIYYGSKEFVKGLKIKRREEELEEIPRRHKKPVRKVLGKIIKAGEGKEILEAIQEGYKQVEVARYLELHYSVISRRLKSVEKARNKT